MRNTRTSLFAVMAAMLVAVPVAMAQGSPADPKVNAQPGANESAAASGTMDQAPSEAAEGGQPAAEVDTNFDGSISRDEAASQGVSDADFDAGDKDGDGLMSKAEYESALAAQK